MSGAAAATAVCRRLRARGAYGRSADGSDWQAGASSLEGYWCLATHEPVGPDDGLVHAQACRAGRACFQSGEAGAAGSGAGGDTGGAGRPGA